MVNEPTLRSSSTDRIYIGLFQRVYMVEHRFSSLLLLADQPAKIYRSLYDLLSWVLFGGLLQTCRLDRPAFA